jgi:hypothetical protein
MFFPRYASPCRGCDPPGCCRNVKFICSVVCLAMSYTAETILVSGFGGIVFNATPTTVFFFFSHVISHSVILSRDHVIELVVALMLL